MRSPGRQTIAGLTLLLVVTAASSLVFARADPASAVPASNWAQWSPPEGNSHDVHGTMQLPAAGFPAAEWASNSRSPVQLPGGSSTYLGASTPPGARYGTSQASSYLNLRPYADNATSPSTTTFDFATATPSAGWSFVLGDVDADQVHITARDAEGRSVPNSDIDRWQQGAFNYAGGADTPTWDAATATLIGNPAAADTTGASDWFTPDRALSSLSFEFTQRAGFPVYQVWFASRSHDVTGTVTGTAQCPATGATVRLLAPDGTTLASAHPTDGGAYSFAGYTAQPGYTVAVDPPATPIDGCEIDGAAQRPVTLADGDATADFALRDVRPEPISGTVTATDGTPVAGVVVTLTDPAGATRTATTDDTGAYLFDDDPVGSGYRISVTVPDGYANASPAVHTVDVTAGQPVTDQDFSLRAFPSVAGTVTGASGPLEDVPVTLTDGTEQRHTVTDAGGHFDFDGVPPGTYAISVQAPDGYAAPHDRDDVIVDRTDRTGQDFALTRVGTIAGTVTVDGTPSAGVRVTITGPAGEQHVRSGSDGTYTFDQLEPATYRIGVQPPAGDTVAGPATRRVTITADGELMGGLDFALRRRAASTSPTPTGSSNNPVVSSSGSRPSTFTTLRTLADTGTPATLAGCVALGLLALGALFVGAGRRRRTSTAHRDH